MPPRRWTKQRILGELVSQCGLPASGTIESLGHRIKPDIPEWKEPAVRVGYVRVSSVDQNTVRQLDGIAVERTFTDKASGKDTNLRWPRSTASAARPSTATRGARPSPAAT
jgi:hypothetical protein